MIAFIVLGIVGVLMVTCGMLEWRRKGLGIVEVGLMLGGVALVCVSVWNQATEEARFVSTLKPSIHLDMRPPPPLTPGVRPPMLPKPGAEQMGDSLISA